MPPLAVILRTAGLIYKIGGLGVELIRDLVKEKQKEDEALAKARREMSQRANDAAHMAGHEPAQKGTPGSVPCKGKGR